MVWTPKKDLGIALRDNSAGQGLLLATLALLSLGVVMVHSAVASVAEPGVWFVRRDVRHTLFVVVAAAVLILGWRLNYRRLAGRPAEGHAGRRGETRFPILAAVLLGVAMVCCVLVFVPGIGYAVGGRYRWIRVGPAKYSIGFQPSELLKVAMVVFLCAWLARPGRDVRSFRRTFLPAMAVVAACVGLVITQDFGTAVILSLTASVVLLLAGVPLYSLVALAAAAGLGGWGLIASSPYRTARFAAMVDPWSQTNPSAYQPRQSLLAVQTGGIFGKGLGNGMIKRGYLPEGATDFIFSTFCEEWGLVGALLLMGLVLMWIWQARRATVRADTNFGRLLCGSLAFLVASQAVLHIAVDLVAAPPTGMGLPFVSAGGSSLITLAAAVALMVSITAHRKPAAPAGVLQ